MLALACITIAIVYEHHGKMVKYYLNLALDSVVYGVQDKALRVIIAKET